MRLQVNDFIALKLTSFLCVIAIVGCDDTYNREYNRTTANSSDVGSASIENTTDGGNPDTIATLDAEDAKIEDKIVNSDAEADRADFDIDPLLLAELERHLSDGVWRCVSAPPGPAGLMRGAEFSFDNGTMHVRSGRVAATNRYVITGILPNVPEGCICTALVNINSNKDMLTLVDAKTMVLSWYGDKAKIILNKSSSFD